MTAGVYVIRCMVTGEEYVGRSVDIQRRWKAQICELDRGYRHWARSHTKRFFEAWEIHGREAFSFAIIEECPEDMLGEREVFHIVARKPAYNGPWTIYRKYRAESA